MKMAELRKANGSSHQINDKMNQENQVLIYKFTTKSLKFLFGDCKINESQIENIIGKLPEIIKEWVYIENHLKEKGFIFKDHNVSKFSGKTPETFVADLAALLDQMASSV
jgi:hypothetical protein